MLERTAATLESCTSLHALPSAAQTLRSRRKLHSGFWQHGAAAIEISSSALPSHAIEPVNVPPKASSETLVASTLLLDFLYPNGAAALIRRFAPGLQNRQTSSIQKLRRSRSRLFTSSSVAASTQPSRSGVPESLVRGDGAETSNGSNRQQDDTVVTEEDGGLGVGQHDELVLSQDEPAAEEDFNGEEHIDAEEDVDGLDATQTHSGPSFAGAGSRPELMRELMVNENTEYFGSIWQLFNQLEPHLQPEFRPEVIVYLYRSANMLDARRVIILFGDTEKAQWSPAVLTSVVKAHLLLGNETAALQLYFTGLDELTMVGGLDELLRHGFMNENWAIVKQVWSSYHSVFLSHGINCGKMARLGAVPKLGQLALLFSEELKMERGTRARTLDVLLKKVARRALQQPCEPHEALPLLKIVDQVKWYNIYLSEAVARGQQEGLPEIYNVYRSFPGTKPYWGILHGMFEIFYPRDVAGLEMVYEDYHVSYGQLDQWGFRKFLKFYASRGDIKSLERLWGNYVQAYKHRNVLQEPETFNHIINAYATLGDVQGARRVFNEMMSKYGVMPSIQSWNILLKSQVASDSFDGALEVFDELCEASSPDAVSFATIMSLTGSYGDKLKTLELFHRAGKMRIAMDVSILHGLVKAYCQNKCWSEALATCVNAKRHNVPGTHPTLWNTLLQFHSERRAFGTLCRVVTIMADNNVEWNTTTHNVLLQALVRCRQTHHAYSLLRQAIRDSTFTLVPEHFSTVMDGGLRTRELGLVEATARKLRRSGLPTSINGTIVQIDALIRRQMYGKKATFEDLQGRELLAAFIEEMIDHINKGNSDEDLKGSVRGADAFYRLRKTIPKAITLFSKYNDFEMVRELHKLQIGLGLDPAGSDGKDLSFTMLFAVLKGNFHENEYDAAMSTWQLIWQKALQAGLPTRRSLEPPDPAKDAAGERGAETPNVLPRMQHILANPTRTMVKLFLAEKDPDGLLQLVNNALETGFKLDRTSMNLVCQALAEMDRWSEACELCEIHLMPKWTGWQLARMRKHIKASLPLDQRREGSAPRWLRPTSYTLILLAKEYMQTKSEAPWSSRATKKWEKAQETFPRVLAAIEELEYTGFGIEKEVFGNRQVDYVPEDRMMVYEDRR